MNAERLGHRALVLGGSLAGLLAARAVAPHFDQVIIVDRAAFGDDAAPRMSAPQTYHLHVLLKGGEQAMETLAPGFLARLEAAGSVPLDPGHDFFSASELGVAKPFETPMRVHGQSRWLLEHCLRQQLRSNHRNKQLEYHSAPTMPTTTMMKMRSKMTTMKDHHNPKSRGTTQFSGQAQEKK